MKKIIGLVLSMVLILSTCLLTSCSSNGKKTLNVYNWGEYICDGADDTLDVIKEFEERTGIKVNYQQFQNNEEMYAKLLGGGVNYDVIIPSDYMIGRMIEDDMLEKINFNNIPNYQYVDESFLNREYDPNGEYSVPYMWGTVGIIYNKTMVADPVDSWDILWNEKYKDKILMFNNARDAIGIGLKKLGYSFNTTDENEIKAAVEELKKQKPVVRQYVMDEIFNIMIGGEAALAPYYAGDAVNMIEENPDLAFAFPNEGVNLFIDAACIPKGAKNKTEAEMFINFLCEKDINLANCEYLNYSTVLTNVKDELSEEKRNNEISYPAENILNNAEVFNNLPKEINDLYSEQWISLMANS